MLVEKKICFDMDRTIADLYVVVCCSMMRNTTAICGGQGVYEPCEILEFLRGLE